MKHEADSTFILFSFLFFAKEREKESGMVWLNLGFVKGEEFPFRYCDLSLIKPTFSEWKWVGLELTIPMIFLVPRSFDRGT